MTTTTTTKPSFLDGFTAGAFKTGKDGRKLFYPWGALGRGYAIPTDQDFQRINLQFKVWTVAMLLLIIVAALAVSPLVGAIVAVANLVVFVAWMPFMLRGCERSDEKMSLKESMTTSARTHSAVMLWGSLIVMLAIAATGIAMLATDPRNAMLAIFVLMFGAVGTASIGAMLVMRRRATGA